MNSNESSNKFFGSCTKCNNPLDPLTDGLGVCSTCKGDNTRIESRLAFNNIKSIDQLIKKANFYWYEDGYWTNGLTKIPEKVIPKGKAVNKINIDTPRFYTPFEYQDKKLIAHYFHNGEIDGIQELSGD